MLPYETTTRTDIRFDDLFYGESEYVFRFYHGSAMLSLLLVSDCGRDITQVDVRTSDEGPLNESRAVEMAQNWAQDLMNERTNHVSNEQF